MSKVWFVTGSASGMGAEITSAALEAGHAVVATGRSPDKILADLGQHGRLLRAQLDVSDPEMATESVQAALNRFGRIDVLVNNAGTSYKGFFEEMTTDQVEAQLATNLLGPMNVSRAVLPVMRDQGSGHIVSISSGAGLMAFEYSSVYAASKFGLEGWMGALEQEVAPYGIHTTIVNPGWFRTDLIRTDRRFWPQVDVPDYAERSAAQVEWWRAQDGHQSGDPSKLAAAILALADTDEPPRRFIAGADAIALAERKIAALESDITFSRNLSVSLAMDMQN